MSRYFQPLFEGDDLLRVPNYNTIVRTLIGGVPTQPFSMATIPPLGSPNPELGQALKQLSAAKHGRPRDAVEKEIFGRLKTKEPDVQGAANPAAPPPAAPATARPVATPQNPSASFLDQWLAKKQQAPPAIPPAAPVSKGQPAQTVPKISTHTSPTIKRQQSPSISPQLAKPQPTKPSQPQTKQDSTEMKVNQNTGKNGGKRDTLGNTIYIDRDGNLRQSPPSGSG